MNLNIIGQFNKGFIICSDDLTQWIFIVDQHAADEKSNYERLSKTLKLIEQPMLQPLKLQCSAIDILTISENNDILTKNGFWVEINEGIAYLKSVPFHKTYTFK